MRIDVLEGTGFQATYLDDYSLAELRQAIPQTFQGLGYGVNNFALNTNPIATAVSLSGAWFSWYIEIDNSSNMSPTQIQNVVRQIMSQFFSDVTVSSYSSQVQTLDPSTGQTIITDANVDKTRAGNATLCESVFGKGSSICNIDSNSLNTTIKNSTISFTTIAIILGLGYVLISTRRK